MWTYFSSNLEEAIFLPCGQFPVAGEDQRSKEKAVFLRYVFLPLNDMWVPGNVKKRRNRSNELLLRLRN